MPWSDPHRLDSTSQVEARRDRALNCTKACRQGWGCHLEWTIRHSLASLHQARSVTWPFESQARQYQRAFLQPCCSDVYSVSGLVYAGAPPGLSGDDGIYHSWQSNRSSSCGAVPYLAFADAYVSIASDARGSADSASSHTVRSCSEVQVRCSELGPVQSPLFQWDLSLWIASRCLERRPLLGWHFRRRSPLLSTTAT